MELESVAAAVVVLVSSISLDISLCFFDFLALVSPESFLGSSIDFSFLIENRNRKTFY